MKIIDFDKKRRDKSKVSENTTGTILQKSGDGGNEDVLRVKKDGKIRTYRKAKKATKMPDEELKKHRELVAYFKEYAVSGNVPDGLPLVVIIEGVSPHKIEEALNGAEETALAYSHGREFNHSGLRSSLADCGHKFGWKAGVFTYNGPANRNRISSIEEAFVAVATMSREDIQFYVTTYPEHAKSLHAALGYTLKKL